MRQVLAPFTVHPLRPVNFNSHFLRKAGILLSRHLNWEEDDDSKLVANWCENGLTETTSILLAERPSGRRNDVATDQMIAKAAGLPAGHERISRNHEGSFAKCQEFNRGNTPGVRSARENAVAGMK